MKRALTDAGFWYALFERRDQYFVQAQEKVEYLDVCQVVLPWPTLYETMNTRFVRNMPALRRFESYLKKPHVILLEDAFYRDAALDLTMDSSINQSRPLSLVDCVLRLMLDDVNMKIDYLMTFNPRDFADVCRSRRIELI